MIGRSARLRTAVSGQLDETQGCSATLVLPVQNFEG